MVSMIVKMLSVLFGAGSLVYFLMFLQFGTAVSMALHLTQASGFLIDFLLSLLFFCQHSIMVRPGFKKRLLGAVPDRLVPCLFSITSGITLIAVIFFWQGVGTPLVNVPSWLSMVMGVGFALSIAGFYWGISSLPLFDPFGIHVQNSEGPKEPALLLRGPYKYMRHPLYFFTLVLIWSSTEFTVDRLLFNLLWSGWIILGSKLEEKELVDQFGEDYLTYQKQIPMLFPLKGSRKN